MKTITYTFENGKMKTTVTDRPEPTRERMAEVYAIINSAAKRKVVR